MKIMKIIFDDDYIYIMKNYGIGLLLWIADLRPFRLHPCILIIYDRYKNNKTYVIKI